MLLDETDALEDCFRQGVTQFSRVMSCFTSAGYTSRSRAQTWFVGTGPVIAQLLKVCDRFFRQISGKRGWLFILTPVAALIKMNISYIE